MIEFPPQAFPDEDNAGMDLRDYFAAKAMQALLSEYPSSENDVKRICRGAYLIAEAMLDERRISF